MNLFALVAFFLLAPKLLGGWGAVAARAELLRTAVMVVRIDFGSWYLIAYYRLWRQGYKISLQRRRSIWDRHSDIVFAKQVQPRLDALELATGTSADMDDHETSLELAQSIAAPTDSRPSGRPLSAPIEAELPYCLHVPRLTLHALKSEPGRTFTAKRALEANMRRFENNMGDTIGGASGRTKCPRVGSEQSGPERAEQPERKEHDGRRPLLLLPKEPVLTFQEG